MLSDLATTTTVLDVAHTLSVSAENAPKNTALLAQSFAGLAALDWLVIGFLALLLLYLLSIGRNRLVAVIFSTYITTVLIQAALRLPFIPQGVAIMNISLWIVFFLVITFILSRSRALDVVTLFDSSWFKVIIFVLLELGLVMSVFYQLVPGEIRFIPSPLALVFNHQFSFATWLLLPLIGFALVRGRIGRFDL